MFHPKKIMTVLGILALLLGPVASVFGLVGADGAYARNGYINAVLAHIRDGNIFGPVSTLAGLMVVAFGS